MRAAVPHRRKHEHDAGPPPAHESYSLFQEPWWLDALAPGRWWEATIETDGRVVARLPYVVRRRFGMTILGQPPLTQTLGPWLAPLAGKHVTQLGTEKRLLRALIEQLPPFDVFEQQFSPMITNALPFYWSGFDASVRYTYRLEDLHDLDRVWHGFDERVRRAVRKAETYLAVEEEAPFETLLELNRRTFARRRRSPPVDDAVLLRLDRACVGRGARRLLAARDTAGRLHGVLYLVWDGSTAYALANARDDRLPDAGAITLLHWEAIRFAAGVTKVFDFEGSMIEPIEHFVRSFGGTRTPYLKVTRRSPRANALLTVRAGARALLRPSRHA